eukprot:scaffold165479_cov35-Tisochrysis_lutea.AAC.5
MHFVNLSCRACSGEPSAGRTAIIPMRVCRKPSRFRAASSANTKFSVKADMHSPTPASVHVPLYECPRHICVGLQG